MEKITKGAIKVLSLVARGADNREKISKELKLSKTWVSDNLTKLEKLKFIIRKRKGNKVLIKLTETSFAQEFRDLIRSKPYVKFEDFLYGLNFRILSYCLFGGKNSQGIANQLGLSKKTIWNRLIILTSRGLLAKKGRFYLTNQKAWPNLYSFLEKMRMFYLGPGRILWKFEEEILFQATEKEEIRGVLTGFSQYPKLGVGMRVIKMGCYSPKKRLSEEEIFVHSLLEISDARELMLGLVFYLKHGLNKKKLEKLAMKYECLEKLNDLKKILKQEKTQVFPLIREKELDEFFRRHKIKWKGN